MPGAAVAGFTPATRGFRFANSWPKVPVTTIEVVRGIEVPIGDASNGLCGGMVFAARDHFESGRALPDDATAPGSGPLYEFVAKRLLDSFDLPRGPFRYYTWMAMPDADTTLGWIATLNRGVGHRTVADELPRVIADIDAGRTSCLGLVCARSADPFDLGENHQVLAWRHQRSGDRVTIWVYDPNQPGSDEARLSFDVSEPSVRLRIRFTGSSKKVRGFFRVGYRRVAPPDLTDAGP